MANMAFVSVLPYEEDSENFPRPVERFAMSSSSNPQPDPTMEEILASIRKIISEDQPDAAKLPHPFSIRGERRQSASQAPVDILELTDEIPADEQEIPPLAVRPADEGIASRDGEPAPKTRTAAHIEDMISESARQAMGRAFAKLDVSPAKHATSASGGILEAIFTRAVQDAMTPALHQWVDSHKTEIMDNLKPLIRDWMDDRLPRLIEAAVRREIGRLAAERLRRR